VDHGFRALASDLVVESEASEYDDDLERLRFLMIRWLEITAGSPALAKIINQEATTGGPRLDYMFDRYIWPVTKTVNRFLAQLESEGRVRHLVFLASDYVRTTTDLATMEGANEAARRAVNGILDLTGWTGARARLWDFEEPPVFRLSRLQDSIRYALGLPHVLADPAG
jgi:hypothetical protein